MALASCVVRKAEKLSWCGSVSPVAATLAESAVSEKVKFQSLHFSLSAGLSGHVERVSVDLVGFLVENGYSCAKSRLGCHRLSGDTSGSWCAASSLLSGCCALNICDPPNSHAAILTLHGDVIGRRELLEGDMVTGVVPS